MKSFVLGNSVAVGIVTIILDLCGTGLAQSVFEFEPRSAQLTAPFVLTNNCICQSVTTNLAAGGRAVFPFTLTNAGTYALVCLVRTSAAETNSLYIDIDNEPQEPKSLWAIPATREFEKRVVFWPENVTPGVVRPPQKKFLLTPGEHRIIVRGRDADVPIARMILSPLPSPPTGLRIVGQ